MKPKGLRWMADAGEQVDVRVSAPQWGLSEDAARALVRDVMQALRAHQDAMPGGMLEVWFASDEDLHDLNKRFRHQDRPTNVLSFAAPAGQDSQLGQLALACEVCQREARERGLPLEAHVRHLVLHGLLHVLGYDHQTAEEADTMEALERAIMRAMGLHDPYVLKEDAPCD